MKKIILGVTGSIAAYKALFLVRLFIKNQYQVKVVMTPSSADFVTPLSFQTLSRNPVTIDIASGSEWNNHVELGLWADAFIVAPATATTIARLASGLAENMLVATYLSARCPVFIAPAMDLDMWKHSSTTKNIRLLESYGDRIIPVGHGELASGLTGDGRMAEPESIYEYVHQALGQDLDLKDKRVMITAGPTKEPIDPVRFIGNHSTGLMGIRLAEECARRGAEVDLILGPTNLGTDLPNIHTVRVITAEEMYKASRSVFPEADIGIFAAAVADYAPRDIAGEKLKKGDDIRSLELHRTRDIAFEMGKLKKPGQLTIGFALETSDEVKNAQIKLTDKKFDLIVLNSLNDNGAGFHHETNKVTIIGPNNKLNKYELKGKAAVAADIIDEVVNILETR